MNYTSIALVIIALWDFEYEKDGNDPNKYYLMRHSFLYKKGLDGKQFTFKQYLMWFLYGVA